VVRSLSAWRIKLAKWSGLPRRERAAFRTAWMLLPLVTFSLWITGLAVTTRRLTRWLPATRPPALPDAAEVAESVALMVMAAAERQPIPAKCLAKSVTLWFLLARLGIDSKVRIGVTKFDGVFDAHAWIEIDGRVLLDPSGVVGQYGVMV
jgi:hypothetical protein